MTDNMLVILNSILNQLIGNGSLIIVACVLIKRLTENDSPYEKRQAEKDQLWHDAYDEAFTNALKQKEEEQA